MIQGIGSAYRKIIKKNNIKTSMVQKKEFELQFLNSDTN